MLVGLRSGQELVNFYPPISLQLFVAFGRILVTDRLGSWELETGNELRLNEHSACRIQAQKDGCDLLFFLTQPASPHKEKLAVESSNCAGRLGRLRPYHRSIR